MTDRQLGNVFLFVGLLLLLGVVAWLLINVTPLGVTALGIAGVGLLVAASELRERK